MIIKEQETNLLESPEELIFREIEENKDSYIKIFQRLIRIDSTNPPGNEMRIALEIENFLKDFGVECDIHQFGDNRSNLVALNPEHQQLFYEFGFRARGYVPCWNFKKDDKSFEDIVVFNYYEGQEPNAALLPVGQELADMLNVQINT